MEDGVSTRLKAQCSKFKAASWRCVPTWRLVSLLLLVMLLAIVPSRGNALARSNNFQLHALAVDEQSAEANFPDTIDFRLKAHGLDATRAELNYKLVGESVTSGEQAEVKSAANADFKLSLDLTTHYLPPGADVEYYWTLTDKSGQTTDTPAKTFKIIDGRHPWKSLTDAQKRVTVHWYNGTMGFGNDLLTTASTALDRLQNEIKAGLQRPAEIWVYATQDDLLNALPKNIPEWVGGKAFPELALVLADVADDNMSDLEIKRVVPHELSHLVLYQATRNPYNSPPAWFDEGLAVHNQGAQDPAEEAALHAAAIKGKLIPLKSLSGSFGANEDTATLSYAESRSAIDFLLSDNRYGPEKFARTVAAFREGVAYDEAFKAGVGVGVDDIDAQWRASLPSQQGSNPVAPAPSAARTGFDFSLWNVFVLVPLAACAMLFLAGGLLTGVFLFRRRSNSREIPTIQHPPPNL